MAVQSGWRNIANWKKDPQFIAAMTAQANGAAVWAKWLPGAIHGTANLRLQIAIVRAQANGAATWARWAPNVPANMRSNTGSALQLNAAAAIAANFT